MALTQVAVTGSELSKTELLAALLSLKKGNFSYRLPDHLVGVDGKIADAFNGIADANQRTVHEFDRVAKAVGKRGRIHERVIMPDVGGSWNAAIKSINTLIGDVVQPTSEMARVIGAVAKGDLTQSINTEAEEEPLKGEFLRTARLVNAMVEQLRSFSSEVTRVAREVGTDGKLGGQAEVKGVSGTWKELTDSVNSMASNLTNQVRNIADVTIAVANGDLSKKITVDVRGEFLAAQRCDQRHGGAAQVLLLRGYPCGQGSGHRRKARRPGRCSRCRRRLERPDRLRQRHGGKPDGPGPQHRPGDHRRGQGRPFHEDHRRRERRDPRAQEHGQHHGGPALLLCIRGYPCGQGSGHRGKARRPGRGERRLGHLERPDGQRQRHGESTSRTRSATSPR